MAIRSVEEAEKLAREHVSLAYRVARCSKRPRWMDFDEVLGAAWEGVRRAADRWDGTRTKFSTFAYTAAAGHVKDYLRGLFRGTPHSRLRNFGQQYSLSLMQEYGRDVADPRLALSHAKDFFEAACRPLSPLERSIVLMKYVEGLTLKTIAERLNISETWARMRHADALAQLRESRAMKAAS